MMNKVDTKAYRCKDREDVLCQSIPSRNFPPNLENLDNLEILYRCILIHTAVYRQSTGSAFLCRDTIHIACFLRRCRSIVVNHEPRSGSAVTWDSHVQVQIRTASAEALTGHIASFISNWKFRSVLDTTYVCHSSYGYISL